MQIGKKDPDPDYRYELLGPSLEKVSEAKDIGVTIDGQINFDKHISDNVKKANSMLALLRRILQHLDEKYFIPLYKTLVRTHLDYVSSVWFPYKSKHI